VLALLLPQTPATRAMIARSPKLEVAGVPLHVLGRADLITLKSHRGSSQDRADIERLTDTP